MYKCTAPQQHSVPQQPKEIYTNNSLTSTTEKFRHLVHSYTPLIH